MLLENFRPGTLEVGLGPDELDRANPDIVITRISAFGQTDRCHAGPVSPRSPRRSVACVSWSVTPTGRPCGWGCRSATRSPGPLRRVRHRDGAVPTEPHQVPLTQRVIDVALNEAVLSMMESLVPDYLAYGVNRERVGGRMEGIAPSNAYPCADGTSIIVAGNGDAIFQRYMHHRPAGPGHRPGPANQRRPLAAPRRTRRRDRRVVDQYNRDEALKILDAVGVPSDRSTPPPTSASTSSTRRET